MALKYPIKIDCGSTYRRLFLWKDDAGNRVNLNGCFGRLQIRERVGADVIINLTSANGGIRIQQDTLESGTQGVFGWVITDEATLDITIKTALYQFYLDFPNGESFRMYEGPVTFSQAVARP